jgi:hypothetical protein
MEKQESHEGCCCPAFGVESGVPLIGLGILLILFGIVPLFILRVPFPAPIAIVLAVFGLFLIWAGVWK